jgi:hypothetical protein
MDFVEESTEALFEYLIFSARVEFGEKVTISGKA